MADELAVAVAQFAPAADKAVNLARIEELTRIAVGRGSRVVVFPEYASYFVDPFDETLAEGAEGLDGPFVTALTTLAGNTGAVIVAGLVESTAEGRRVHNTVVAVDDNGILARYRKTHLYDAFGQRESDWVEPGPLDPPETFELEGVTFGIQTCYDVRFPETSRRLADAGTEVALIPAEWVRGPLKEHHWRTLLQARAIENTMYVAAADHPPPLGVGLSMVVDPQGVVLADAGIGTDVALGFVQREELDRVRRINPALRLRRYRVTPI